MTKKGVIGFSHACLYSLHFQQLVSIKTTYVSHPMITTPPPSSSLSLQPSLNELPVDSGDRKRPANDENVDPALLPPAKQPRTIEIDLPSRHDDSSEPKGQIGPKDWKNIIELIRKACLNIEGFQLHFDQKLGFQLHFDHHLGIECFQLHFNQAGAHASWAPVLT